MAVSPLRRFSFLGVALLLLSTAFVLSTPGAAMAHGTCGLGEPWEGKSFIAGYYDDDISTFYGEYMSGETGFRCLGGETHWKIFVYVKIFKCARQNSISCSGPWQLVKSSSDGCLASATCGVKISAKCSGTDTLKRVKGAWIVYNTNNAVAHQSPDWPNYTWEPSVQGGSPYEDCG